MRSRLRCALDGWEARLAACGLACVGLATSAPASATTRGAEELLRQARAHEVVREDELAARRYSEALALDPTCRECYLGLGALRLRRGDAREAERVYAAALDHVPGALEALRGRALARRACGNANGSESDLADYAARTGTTTALRELALWYGEDGRPPMQLATWRRVLALANAELDEPLALEARTTVRALQILLGSADPATAPPSFESTRRALAHIARRGGG